MPNAKTLYHAREAAWESLAVGKTWIDGTHEAVYMEGWDAAVAHMKREARRLARAKARSIRQSPTACPADVPVRVGKCKSHQGRDRHACVRRFGHAGECSCDCGFSWDSLRPR